MDGVVCRSHFKVTRFWFEPSPLKINDDGIYVTVVTSNHEKAWRQLPPENFCKFYMKHSSYIVLQYPYTTCIGQYPIYLFYSTVCYIILILDSVLYSFIGQCPLYFSYWAVCYILLVLDSALSNSCAGQFPYTSYIGQCHI